MSDQKNKKRDQKPKPKSPDLSSMKGKGTINRNAAKQLEALGIPNGGRRRR